MKCAYVNCKLGKEVDKEDAVYIGRKYYHKDCYKKKDKKESCKKILIDMNFIDKNINIALKRLIDDENFDAEYVEFAINYIKNNKLKLTNPFGLKYYLQNFNIQTDYETAIRIKTIKEMKSVEFKIEDESKFSYKKSDCNDIFKII